MRKLFALLSSLTSPYSYHLNTLGYIVFYTCGPRAPPSHHITSHHITSHHITSHHITSHHITSHHITSHHITSHHITSHHITSPTLFEYIKVEEKMKKMRKINMFPF